MIAKIGISAGVGLTAATYFAYHCYSPTSELYGATLNHCSDPKHLALTYDDGPNDIYTERLLEVLARHDVKATFFLIGKFVAARPHLARAIASAGHLLGNHTHTHPNLLLLTRGQVRKQLADCSKAIADATGSEARFFRPPFGARRPAILQVCRELGLTPVMWDITCFDWRQTTADAVERRAIKRIERDRLRGHVLLLHDGGHAKLGMDRAHTVEASERLISRYEKNYSFRRIDEI